MTRRRTTAEFQGDLRTGMLIGLSTGLGLTLWALLLDAVSGGGLRNDPTINLLQICIVYLAGMLIAGLIGGVLRPYLGNLFGLTAMAFCTATVLYGGMSFVDENTLSASDALRQGLAMACFATPIWVALIKWRGWDKKFAAALTSSSFPGTPPTGGSGNEH